MPTLRIAVEPHTANRLSRPFDETLGSAVFATLEDCPPGYRECLLRKSLVEGQQQPSPEQGTAEGIAVTSPGRRKGRVARLTRGHGGGNRRAIRPMPIEEGVR